MPVGVRATPSAIIFRIIAAPDKSMYSERKKELPMIGPGIVAERTWKLFFYVYFYIRKKRNPNDLMSKVKFTATR